MLLLDQTFPICFFTDPQAQVYTFFSSSSYIGNILDDIAGKTSTILAAARDLFGDLWRSRILELNASDERGIAMVRDKIKTFAQQTVSSSSNAKIPPFKVETIYFFNFLLYPNCRCCH